MRVVLLSAMGAHAHRVAGRPARLRRRRRDLRRRLPGRARAAPRGLRDRLARRSAAALRRRAHGDDDAAGLRCSSSWPARWTGPRSGLMWAAALAVDYGGLVARGDRGLARRGQPLLRAPRPGHHHRPGRVDRRPRASGRKGSGLDAGIIAGALLGVAVAAALWWAYFDFVALVAARVLRQAPPDEQVRIARDSYTYLHLPMVAGIVLFAVGVEEDAGPRRRRARGGAGRRPVRRGGALPGRAERAQAAQHRLVQLPAAGRPRPCWPCSRRWRRRCPRCWRWRWWRSSCAHRVRDGPLRGHPRPGAPGSRRSTRGPRVTPSRG